MQEGGCGVTLIQWASWAASGVDVGLKPAADTLADWCLSLKNRNVRKLQQRGGARETAFHFECGPTGGAGSSRCCISSQDTYGCKNTTLES